MRATALVPKAVREDFLAQLMAHEGWPRFRAEAALEEYRRFLYLARINPAATLPACFAGLQQLHLAYAAEFHAASGGSTRLPGGPMQPVAGMANETAQAETLALYQLEFTTMPLADFWPQPDKTRRRPGKARLLLALAFISAAVGISLLGLGLFGIGAALCFIAIGASFASTNV